MNEEVLFRMGFNATAVQKGTASMLDQQKKAAMDYVSFWKRAISEKEAAEVAADVRAAQRNNRARTLQRQRAKERSDDWKRELELQRKASGARPEERNTRGVSVGNLARNVIGRRGVGGHVGHGIGGLSSGALQEGMVVIREISRGDFAAAARSISILTSRIGMLGKVASLVINPITGVIAGVGAGIGINNMASGYARRLRHDAGAAGFSTGGYQTVMMQAARESGGVEAARAAMKHLGGSVNSSLAGDTGGIQKFRRWGINISGMNAEDAWVATLKKLDETSNAARKAAMAQDLLGESYEKFMITIKDGADGFIQARERLRKFQPSAGGLAALEENRIKGLGIFEKAKGLVVKGYAAYSTNRLFNTWTGMGDYARAVDEGAEIDERIRAFNKTRKPRAMNMRLLKELNPEAAMSFREATLGQQEAQASMDDRLKVGMGDMVGMARQLSGHIRPRLWRVTDRMRTAMKIDDIEARAQNAFMSGDDATFKKLRGEAEAMRKANPWMTFADKNPTVKMELQLEKANEHLQIVRSMVEYIIRESK